MQPVLCGAQGGCLGAVADLEVVGVRQFGPSRCSISSVLPMTPSPSKFTKAIDDRGRLRFR